MPLGIRYILIATLFFTGMQTMAKSLSHFPVFEIIFFRSAITAILCILFLKKHKISLIGNNQKLLFLRAILGISSMYLFFITLIRIPMGASVSLKYLSPIFTAIFAVILLKEKVKPIQWLYFLGAFLGAFLLKNFDSRIDQLNLFLGIAGALAGGLVYVTIRKIGKSEHPIVIVNYFMSLSAIISGILLFSNWKTPNSIEMLSLLTMGVMGYYGQVFMTKAFQNEQANRIVQFKYVEIVYSVIIGLLWFGESYSLISFLGIVLMLICMVLNVLTKADSSKEKA